MAFYYYFIDDPSCAYLDYETYLLLFLISLPCCPFHVDHSNEIR